MTSLIAPFLIAACLISTGARAQNVSQALPSANCAQASDVSPVHLYGVWQAELEGQAAKATVLFERHPELGDSVRGHIERDGVKTLIAGDVDDGDFTLEESHNGQTISATWLGRVSDNACGKEITGTWTHALNPTPIPFILRKVPGWQ